MDKLKERWLRTFHKESTDKEEWWVRKQKLFKERQAEIVRIRGNGHIYRTLHYDYVTTYYYNFHISFLIKQKKHFYIEEQIIPFQFQLSNDGAIYNHKEMYERSIEKQSTPPSKAEQLKSDNDLRFAYNQTEAVKYAEHWWNSYNPEFRTFSVDCTNFVSQCLLAGGAPMRGAPVRDQGWWYGENNWSFSWAVAHSMRWYLSGSTTGLKGKEVETAGELYPGDIICYDFQGDGRWDHNTIVVAKDANDMPLVNAHTDNSRHRYWSYEDSSAWTPEIQYKFFRINES